MPSSNCSTPCAFHRLRVNMPEGILPRITTISKGYIMQAARIEKPGYAVVVSVPEPEPGPDEVVIRVRAAGICGTDIHILRGEYEAIYPLIPGHEFSGEVASVG